MRGIQSSVAISDFVFELSKDKRRGGGVSAPPSASGRGFKEVTMCDQKGKIAHEMQVWMKRRCDLHVPSPTKPIFDPHSPDSLRAGMQLLYLVATVLMRL